MNRQETGAIMDILKAAYPRFYADQREAMNALNLWHDMFADDDVRIVAAAVKALIATDEKGFPPHIGAVKAEIRRITSPREMSDGEAWSKIARAIRNGIYGAKEEFEALPPELKRVVGSPEQIREWAMMDSDTVHSVVASNVQRAFRAVSVSQRKYDLLPSDVKNVIQMLSEGMGMEKKREELPEWLKEITDEQ